MPRMFGTDGVRGIANTELTGNLAYDLGRAGAQALTQGTHKPTVIIGSDTRRSCDLLKCALMAGICSVGAHAVDLGVLPTPAIAAVEKKPDTNTLTSSRNTAATCSTSIPGSIARSSRAVSSFPSRHSTLYSQLLNLPFTARLTLRPQFSRAP